MIPKLLSLAKEETPYLARTVNLLRPSLPDLVVTRITPLAARDPYTAAAAASFNIVMLSISFGLIMAMGLLVFTRSASSPLIMATPSTTYNGLLPALIELVPRIRMLVLEPGCPELWVICTPAILPDNILSREVAGISANCSAETEAMDPVFASRLVVPYATTTTSSNASLADSSST